MPSARLQALADLAVALTEAPWSVRAPDLDRLRDAGVSPEGVEQAITVAAFFNYFTRVADGTGIPFDYESPLPRLQIDLAREPAPRPPAATWEPSVDGSAPPPLVHRPATVAAIAPWRAYLLDSETLLTRRDRRVVARAAAAQTCDPGATAAFADAEPRDAREQALVAYADKLSLTPWRMAAADLAPLRSHGLDDEALLHVIVLTAHQNAVSRLHHGLAAQHRRLEKDGRKPAATLL